MSIEFMDKLFVNLVLITGWICVLFIAYSHFKAENQGAKGND
jgi:hypothetical protein